MTWESNKKPADTKGLPLGIAARPLEVFCPAYGMANEARRRRALNHADKMQRNVFDTNILQPGATADCSLAGNRWFPTATVARDLRALWRCRYWWPLRGGYGCRRLWDDLAALAEELARHQHWWAIQTSLPGTRYGDNKAGVRPCTPTCRARPAASKRNKRSKSCCDQAQRIILANSKPPALSRLQTLKAGALPVVCVS